MPFHSPYQIVFNDVYQDLEFNMLAGENGESDFQRSLQKGTYVSEKKCWLESVWQTKEKHMQRNMIMLISCQGLFIWASYVNHTTGCICTA